MSKTSENRLYGRGVYLKVPVPQTEAVNTNVTYFKKAIALIGKGSEGAGRKKIQNRTGCTGNEIRKIYKVVSTYANYRFVQENANNLGIEEYYSCVRLSIDRFKKIIEYILTELVNMNQTHIFEEYLRNHPLYNQTVFQAMFHEMLASWMAMNLNSDLCNKYNKHIDDNAHIISNNMYNSVRNM